MNKLARLARNHQMVVGKKTINNGSFKLFTFTVRSALSSPTVHELLNQPKMGTFEAENVNERVNEL